MSKEEEAKILEPFKARAKKGKLVEITEIAQAYQAEAAWMEEGNAAQQTSEKGKRRLLRPQKN